jgi:hypothetical protein
LSVFVILLPAFSHAASQGNAWIFFPQAEEPGIYGAYATAERGSGTVILRRPMLCSSLALFAGPLNDKPDDQCAQENHNKLGHEQCHSNVPKACRALAVFRCALPEARGMVKNVLYHHCDSIVGFLARVSFVSGKSWGELGSGMFAPGRPEIKKGTEQGVERVQGK